MWQNPGNKYFTYPAKNMERNKDVGNRKRVQFNKVENN